MKTVIFVPDDLKKNTFKPAARPIFDASKRELFIHQYRDLIGELSFRHHSRLWWATDMASKNRFKSKLAEFLQEFLEAVDLINALKDGDTLVLNASDAVIESLHASLEEKNIRWIDKKGPWLRQWGRKIKLLRKTGALFLSSWTMVLRIIQTRLILGNWLKKIHDKQSTSRYVIKTFIYDHSFDKQGVYKDIFFGQLPEYLKRKVSVLFLGNILGDLKTGLRNIRKCPNTDIVPIESCITIPDVLSALWEILTFKSSLGNGFVFFNYNVDDILAYDYETSFKGIQIYQYLHYAVMHRLSQKINISHYLQTCENNPWEFMSLWAIKDYSPQTHTIGYQHTVVPQASLNMFPSAKERNLVPLPQRILTVGDVNKETMLHYGSYAPEHLMASCALRFEYLQGILPVPRQGNIRRVLLAIEGVLEAHPMVDYVIEQLTNQNDFEVLIRTHPTMPWSAFEEAFHYQLEKKNNFKASKGTSLKEDILWSDVVVYWGSTVGIEAISLGKPVVNFMTGAIVNFDPLFNFDDFKWVADKNQPLPELLRSIDALTGAEFLDRQMRATQYIKRYFQEVNPQAMDLFLFDRVKDLV